MKEQKKPDIFDRAIKGILLFLFATAFILLPTFFAITDALTKRTSELINTSVDISVELKEVQGYNGYNMVEIVRLGGEKEYVIHPKGFLKSYKFSPNEITIDTSLDEKSEPYVEKTEKTYRTKVDRPFGLWDLLLKEVETSYTVHISKNKIKYNELLEDNVTFENYEGYFIPISPYKKTK